MHYSNYFEDIHLIQTRFNNTKLPSMIRDCILILIKTLKIPLFKNKLYKFTKEIGVPISPSGNNPIMKTFDNVITKRLIEFHNENTLLSDIVTGNLSEDNTPTKINHYSELIDTSLKSIPYQYFFDFDKKIIDRLYPLVNVKYIDDILVIKIYLNKVDLLFTLPRISYNISFILNLLYPNIDYIVEFYINSVILTFHHSPITITVRLGEVNYLDNSPVTHLKPVCNYTKSFKMESI